jgi:hypothetical protein
MNKYLVAVMAMLVFAGSNSFAKDNAGGSDKAAAIAAAKADREAKTADKKAQLDAAKTARAAKIAERKANKDKTASDKQDSATTDSKKNLSNKGQDIVDNREARQAKRIQHGIDKGYLTPDEITKMNAQQKSITTLESSLTGDGSMSKQDFKQMQEQLNTASHCIWGEKHDTDGKQMAAYRFGKNVFAKNDLTAKMADPNLSKSDAKKICGDFKTMMGLKKQLSGDVTGAEREKLQAQYDDLLNKYFEVK